MFIDESKNIIKVINPLGNRAQQLIKRKSLEMNIKLESIPFTIPKPENKLGSVLTSSNFFQVRQKLGHLISIDGKACLGLMKWKDSYLVRPMRLIDWEIIGNKEFYVNATDNTYWSGLIGDTDRKLLIYTRYFFKDGVPTLEKYVSITNQTQNKEIENFILDEFTQSFPWLKELPVKIFKNNDSMDTDVEQYGVGGMLEQLDRLDKDYISIWNVAKSKIYFNDNINEDDNHRKTEQIEAGIQNYVSDSSFDAKLGTGTSVLSGNTSPAILEQHMGVLEISIEKAFGLLRDSLLTANQKNIIEIVGKDEFMIEIINIKRSQRQLEYNDFFRKACLLLNVKVIQPTLGISQIDKMKMDYVQATITQLEAQAKSQLNKANAPSTPTVSPTISANGEQGESNGTNNT